MTEWRKIDPVGLVSDAAGRGDTDIADWLDDVLQPQRQTLAAAYDKGKFLTQWQASIADPRVLGATWGAEYGGTGLSPRAYGYTVQVLERFDAGLRSFVSVTAALCGQAIYKFGSEDQKHTWLPKLATGDLVGSFALTEPQGGSDPSAMTVTATSQGSGYRLNGTKHWITNGGYGDIVVVWARVGDDVRGFVIDQAATGMNWQRLEHKLSLRASITAHLELQDVHVEADRMLPKAKGLGAPLACLNEARFGIAFGAIGAAIDCYEAALAFSQNRLLFGKPLSQMQLTQEKLADMLAKIAHMQLLADRLATLKERGDLKPMHVSLAKRDNIRMALEIARSARELHGAQGILGEHCVMRHMCNLETVQTYEGTHDVHTLVLGMAATGQAAFR